LNTHFDMEGPNNGFSARGWNENLPRDGKVQSPWELVKQSLTSIVAMKNPSWIITITEITHVSPLRRRRRLDLSCGSWGRSSGSFFAGEESLMSMNSELSSSIDWFSRENSRFYLQEEIERERMEIFWFVEFGGKILFI